MPTYISLVQFTDKGIQAAKETTQRVAEWAARVQSMGVSVKQMYWTLGEYDQVCVFEAPDDETAASVLLAADLLGNIRTQTLRAFTASEMEKILAAVPDQVEVRCRISRRPFWVKSRHLNCNGPCLLYHRKRTCAVQEAMSALGQ